MTPPLSPERATQIRVLFEELCELPAEQRSSFLDRACRGDDALRRELTSLIQQTDSASPRFDRLAQSVVQPVLRALRDDPSGLNVLLDGLAAPGAGATAPDSLVGRTVSHFEILAPLGRGGMGVVYRARDRDLDRTVALKFLPPWLSADAEAKARFIREARAASALDHVNIATVYEIGETPDQQLFIAMAYYEGETLARKLADGPLPIERAVAIATQLADGLSRAHARGVVHRDIKPGNILITPEGVVKLLDFGLAKLSSSATVTLPGTTAGTAAYMSPEQAGGGVVDHRTDVWSLGVVIFEMLTGQRPFRGDNATALVHAILRESPPSVRALCPGVSSSLADLVERCLAKDPAQRPASMGDVLADLRAVAPASGPARTWRGIVRVARRPRTRSRSFAVAGALVLAVGAAWFAKNFVVVGVPRLDSLAVLPFRDLAGKPEQDYFADGMQEALIAELGKISGLRVISHQSTVRYRGSDRSVPEIARELNVQGVVTASVFRDGDNVHLRVQLIDAFPEERPRWSHTYQDELRDVLTMHNEVARAIAHAVRVNLTAADETRLATTRTVSPETYEAYLRGMHELNKSTPEGMARGLTHFEAAVEREPADPLAYTGLALGYVTAGHAAGGDPVLFLKARAAVDRALKLDPTLVDVHVALANLKLYHEWDWSGFEAAAARVNELNPNIAILSYHHAWYHVVRQRFDEAVREHRRAIELDPLTPLHTVWLPSVYWWFGRYEETLIEVEKAQAQFPDHAELLFAHGLAAGALGRFDEAIAAHERLVAGNPDWRWVLGCTYALAGRTSEARRVVEQWGSRVVDPWTALGYACLYGQLGDTDEALRWLEHRPAYAWIPWVVQTPYFAGMREDPRFVELLRRLDLPEHYLHSAPAPPD